MKKDVFCDPLKKKKPFGWYKKKYFFFIAEHFKTVYCFEYDEKKHFLVLPISFCSFLALAARILSYNNLWIDKKNPWNCSNIARAIVIQTY